MGKAYKPKSKRQRDRIARSKQGSSNSSSVASAPINSEENLHDEKKFWKIAGGITLVVLVLLYFVFR